MIDPFIAFSVRGALAALMLAACVHKLRDLTGFRQALDDYRLLPAFGLPAIALLLPLIEGASAVATLLGSVAGPIAIASLLLLYAGAIAINLRRGRRTIDCGCLAFGKTGQPIRAAMVLRNLALAVLAILVATAPSGGRPLIWIDWIGLTCTVATAALLYAIMEAAMQTAREIKP
ncbi:MauE/DoxX family redox-associated membrane protein [Rhizorhabdus sp. FW153]|uniref:MauE/DoxX family redox-associated membrane protein n=1 Tax=Rhizorhabdus sp. FW153 TaxID=3400216 RepID=UPI003CEB31A8